MLNVADVLDELDILALDSEVLTTFGNSPAIVRANLEEKRRVAVEDWLYNGLVKRGMSPEKHSIRFAPDSVLAVTGGVYSDRTAAAGDNTNDTLTLATLLPSAPTDVLYIGASQPMTGLWATMVDSLNINTLTGLQAAYWNGGAWASFNSLVDGTTHTTSIAFSGGGRVSWKMPLAWQPRPLNSQTSWRFWLRLTTSQPVSAATTLTHLLPIRRSRLTNPAALKTLALLYSESWGVQNGQWREKAEEYTKLADQALESATQSLVEFQTTEEQAVVVADVTPPDPSLLTWERG